MGRESSSTFKTFLASILKSSDRSFLTGGRPRGCSEQNYLEGWQSSAGARIYNRRGVSQLSTDGCSSAESHNFSSTELAALRRNWHTARHSVYAKSANRHN